MLMNVDIRKSFPLFFSSCIPAAAPPNKKRAWSWPAYLEEEKAVSAPVKLFKEVFFLLNTAPFFLFILLELRVSP